jgi:hypothetical protein
MNEAQTSQTPGVLTLATEFRDDNPPGLTDHDHLQAALTINELTQLPPNCR